MTLEQINATALTLYRDPGLRPILVDALAELPSPMTWSQLLERSGTLERLAELMTIQGHGSHRVPGPLEYWLEHVGLPVTRLIVMPDGYQRLCGAFAVPAVSVEVGTTGYPFRSIADAILARDVWSAPTVPLALAVLRKSIGYNPEVTWEIQDWREAFASGLRPLVRQYAPQASRYRLRLGAGEWVERTL